MVTTDFTALAQRRRPDATASRFSVGGDPINSDNLHRNNLENTGPQGATGPAAAKPGLSAATLMAR